jgi:hypothetical protein
MNVIRFSDLCAQGKVQGRRVFIRADLNVPQDDQGRITEDTRIRASLPCIRMALDAGAAVDALLLETTGLADPAPLACALAEGGAELATLAVVVDAEAAVQAPCHKVLLPLPLPLEGVQALRCLTSASTTSKIQGSSSSSSAFRGTAGPPAMKT